MLTPEILLSIESSVLCWLATVDKNGQPNVSPKEVFTSYGTDHILIANIMSPQSVKNIKVNSQVCVSFINVLVQKGYQVKGKAKVMTKKTKEFKLYHPILEAVAGSDFPIKSIIKIKVESHKPIMAPRYVLFPETTEVEQMESAKGQYGI